MRGSVECPVAVHRWFSNGEGWAYHPSFAEHLGLLRELVQEELQSRSSLRQGERRLRYEPFMGKTLMIVHEVDKECTDSKARRRRPTVLRAMLLDYQPDEAEARSLAERLLRLQPESPGPDGSLALSVPKVDRADTGETASSDTRRWVILLVLAVLAAAATTLLLRSNGCAVLNGWTPIGEPDSKRTGLAQERMRGLLKQWGHDVSKIEEAPGGRYGALIAFLTFLSHDTVEGDHPDAVFIRRLPEKRSLTLPEPGSADYVQRRDELESVEFWHEKLAELSLHIKRADATNLRKAKVYGKGQGDDSVSSPDTAAGETHEGARDVMAGHPGPASSDAPSATELKRQQSLELENLPEASSQGLVELVECIAKQMDYGDWLCRPHEGFRYTGAEMVRPELRRYALRFVEAKPHDFEVPWAERMVRSLQKWGARGVEHDDAKKRPLFVARCYFDFLSLNPGAEPRLTKEELTVDENRATWEREFILRLPQEPMGMDKSGPSYFLEGHLHEKGLVRALRALKGRLNAVEMVPQGGSEISTLLTDIEECMKYRRWQEVARTKPAALAIHKLLTKRMDHLTEEDEDYWQLGRRRATIIKDLERASEGSQAVRAFVDHFRGVNQEAPGEGSPEAP
ncbi:MAG: hypothetical protein ACOC7S_00035 [Planctomycetota bacterium]